MNTSPTRSGGMGSASDKTLAASMTGRSTMNLGCIEKVGNPNGLGGHMSSNQVDAVLMMVAKTGDSFAVYSSGFCHYRHGIKCLIAAPPRPTNDRENGRAEILKIDKQHLQV